MLKIKRDDKIFSLLETATLADASITERNDLQEFIANSPAAFFAEHAFKILGELVCMLAAVVPSHRELVEDLTIASTSWY